MQGEIDIATARACAADGEDHVAEPVPLALMALTVALAVPEPAGRAGDQSGCWYSRSIPRADCLLQSW